jgi:hypothetical protein
MLIVTFLPTPMKTEARAEAPALVFSSSAALAAAAAALSLGAPTLVPLALAVLPEEAPLYLRDSCLCMSALTLWPEPPSQWLLLGLPVS